MDISQTIHMLGDLLGKVISDLESPEIFEIEEHIRADAKARRAGDRRRRCDCRNESQLYPQMKPALSPPHLPLILIW
ncbi:MAG: hypothetical protein IPN96_10705 [Anaerolineales bacterium]|nr:hypothetical protein [Anaerolineales bacterium]